MNPSTVFSAGDTNHALAMDASTTARISKFQGNNFHTWKFKMQMVMEERDLWEVTSGGDQDGALRHRVGPSNIQEEVTQGTRDHLSCDGGLTVVAGSFGEERV